jgi:signal peptidase I
MTLRKAYINLSLAFILIMLTVMLYALNVSRLTIEWTMTIYILTTIIALACIVFNIVLFKKKKESITDNYIKKHQFEILDWMAFLSISMMLILTIFMFLILPTNVDGSSMKPTLIDGERVLMYHFNYQPKRNDVIIVHITDRYIDTSGVQVNLSSEYEDKDQVYFVKRVVAIPGDTVTFEEIGTSDVYHILINGEIYQNQYFQIYQVDDPGRLKMLSYLDENNILRENQFFAFGDNESFSYDSRNIGAIHAEDIIGKAIYKLWPLGGISNG